MQAWREARGESGGKRGVSEVNEALNNFELKVTLRQRSLCFSSLSNSLSLALGTSHCASLSKTLLT